MIFGLMHVSVKLPLNIFITDFPVRFAYITILKISLDEQFCFHSVDFDMPTSIESLVNVG